MKNRYEIRGDKVYVFANGKGTTHEIEIDKSALARVNEFPNSWYAHPHRNTYYACGVMTVNGKRQNVKLHRWLMNPPDDMVVDHIDGNALRNTYDNLRTCTPSENGQNVRTPHELPRGVKYHGKRFRAVMVLNQERFDLGVYDTVQEADDIVRYYRSKYMPFSTEALNHSTYTRDDLINELREMRNRKRKSTSSQYVGVYRMKDGRWGAQFSISGQGKPRTTRFVGGYNHETVAAISRDIAVFKCYGCSLPRGTKFNHPDLFNADTVTWDAIDSDPTLRELYHRVD